MVTVRSGRDTEGEGQLKWAREEKSDFGVTNRDERETNGQQNIEKKIQEAGIMKTSRSRTLVNGKKNLKDVREEFERKRNWHNKSLTLWVALS